MNIGLWILSFQSVSVVVWQCFLSINAPSLKSPISQEGSGILSVSLANARSSVLFCFSFLFFCFSFSFVTHSARLVNFVFIQRKKKLERWIYFCIVLEENWEVVSWVLFVNVLVARVGYLRVSCSFNHILRSDVLSKHVPSYSVLEIPLPLCSTFQIALFLITHCCLNYSLLNHYRLYQNCNYY